MTTEDDNACTTIKCTMHILFYSHFTACALVCHYCVKNNGLSPKQHSLVLVSKDDIFLIISCMNLIKRVFCYYFCTCIFAGIFFSMLSPMLHMPSGQNKKALSSNYGFITYFPFIFCAQFCP